MRRQYVSLALMLFIIQPIKSAGANTFEITPTVYYFNYQEFDQNNALLNIEEGFIPGVKLSYASVAKLDSLKFNASFYGGSVDYDGRTQLGLPHETETNEQLARIGISYSQHEETYYPGLLFVGLHYWYWDRDILTRNGVQGLHEQYSWYETEVGLKFNSKQTGQSRYWLEVSAMYNFKPEMTLFLPSSEVDFSLGSKLGYRFRAGKTWTRKGGISTAISIFTEYWEFGRSNTVFTTDFFGSSGFLTEPDSQSFHSGIEFSFIFNL
ncbi:MAG: hypothetical protein IH811_04185 [Proteobacteria bacterium]|nr:hypothetical protein [Pseudomonadota bacterium]